MQDSTDVDARRPIILYIIVAVVLFAALILGVRFAKNRADFYAQQQTEQSKTASNQGGQTKTTPSTPTTTAAPISPPAPSVSVQSTPAPTPVVALEPPKPAVTEATPARVPSTGPEQVFLTLASLCSLAFAGASYIRAKRRLQALATQKV